jgi:hypothetical protein
LLPSPSRISTMAPCPGLILSQRIYPWKLLIFVSSVIWNSKLLPPPDLMVSSWLQDQPPSLFRKRYEALCRCGDKCEKAQDNRAKNHPGVHPSSFEEPERSRQTKSAGTCLPSDADQGRGGSIQSRLSGPVWGSMIFETFNSRNTHHEKTSSSAKRSSRSTAKARSRSSTSTRRTIRGTRRSS